MADFNMDNVLSGEDVENDDFDVNDDVETSDDEQDDSQGEAADGTDSDDDGWDDDNDATSDGGQGEAGPQGDTVYSNLAKACFEDGIFGNGEAVNYVKDADGFRQLMNSEINARLDYAHRRVLAALDAGVPQTEIQGMETIIDDLNHYDQINLADESDEGLNNRKEIIYRAAIFNGKDDARARKEVDKSIKAGTDIEDAREGLASMRQYVSQKYEAMVNQNKQRQNEMLRQREEQSRQMVNDIMSTDGFTGALSPQTRRRIVNNCMVASERMPDGRQVTPLQAFFLSNPYATRIVGELFTLTDGFRNPNAITDTKVRKGVSRGLASMERKLQGSNPAPSGGMRYAGGDGDIDQGRYELEI